MVDNTRGNKIWRKNCWACKMRQFKGLLRSGCCHTIHTAHTVTVCTAAHPATLQCHPISVMSYHVTISCHTLQLRPPSSVFSTCRLVFLNIISPFVVQSLLCTHANSSVMSKSLFTSQINNNSYKVASTSVDSSVGKKKWFIFLQIFT